MERHADHRWTTRQPLRAPVALYRDGELLLEARARDISFGGMFVETHDVRLPLNEKLIARFEGAPRTVGLPVRVIRASDDGAGLMFSHFTRETIDVLQDIVGSPN